MTKVRPVSDTGWFCTVFGIATVSSAFVLPEATAGFAIAAMVAAICFLCALSEAIARAGVGL